MKSTLKATSFPKLLLKAISKISTKLYRGFSWAKRSRFLNSANFYGVIPYTQFSAREGTFSLFYRGQRGKDFERGKTTVVTEKMRKFWGLQSKLDTSRKIGNWMFPLKKSTKYITQPSRPALTMLSEREGLVSDVETIVTNFIEDKLFFKEE